MSDEIFRALGRIEGKLDAVDQTTTEIKSTLEKHNKRIKSVESFKTQALTLAAVVGAAAGVLWDLIKSKLGA